MSEPEILSPVIANDAEVNNDRAPWTVLDVVLTAAFTFFVMVLAAGVITNLVPSLRHARVEELRTNLGLILSTELAAYAGMFAFTVQLVHHRSSLRFADAIAWRTPSNALPFALLGIVLAISINFASTLLSRFIPKTLPIDQYFRTSQSAWLMAAFAILVAPVFEELFFRGLLYPALRRHMPTGGALVITAFAFALIHQGQLARAWAPLLMLFIVGLVLTGVRARAKSVAASYIVHATYNATIFVLIFVATSGFRHMEKLQ